MRMLINRCFYNNIKKTEKSPSDYKSVFECSDIEADKKQITLLRERHLLLTGEYADDLGMDYYRTHTNRFVFDWEYSLDERHELWKKQWELINELGTIKNIDPEMISPVKRAMELFGEYDPEFYGCAVTEAADEFGVDVSELGSILGSLKKKKYPVRILKGFAPTNTRGGDDLSENSNEIISQEILELDEEEGLSEPEFKCWTCILIDQFDCSREVIVFTKELLEPIKIGEVNFINSSTLKRLRKQRELGLPLGRGHWRTWEAVEAWGKGLFLDHLTIHQLWGFPFLEKEWNDDPFCIDVTTGSNIELGFPSFCAMHWFQDEKYWLSVSAESLLNVFIRTSLARPYPLFSAIKKRRDELSHVRLPLFETNRVKRLSSRLVWSEFGVEKSKEISITGLNTLALFNEACRYCFHESQEEKLELFKKKENKPKKKKQEVDDRPKMFPDSLD